MARSMAWSGVVCLLMVWPAYAQRQVGSDGHALDRNLQTGSAGVNAPSRRLPPGSYQDAIITGNVGGLHRFRGDIDYRAPGEFSGRTSADDTYLFRLRSITPTGREYQNPALLSQRAGGPLLLRSGSGVTSGEVTRQAYRLGGSPEYLRRDDATALSVERGPLRAAASLDAAALSIPAPRPGFIDEVEPGRSLEVVTSPLRGVQREALRLRSVQPSQPRPGEEPAGVPGAKAEDELQGAGRKGAERMALPPAVLSGERLLHPDQTQRAQAWRGAEPKPGEDVYSDLLRRARGEQANDEEQALAPIGDRLGGAPPTQGPGRGERVGDRLGGAEPRRAEQANEDAAFDRVLRQLRYDLPPLASLASGTGTRFDQSMAAAERLMAEGKYLQAEATYARAMAIPQGTPLAVVGYTHAQIGAGLHAAAATGLRRLFTHHPELIAARYTQPVLPAEDRMAEVQEELQELGNSSSRPDILLLTAYVAYQQGDRERAEGALATMVERAPQDPLVPLLRRIWGTGEPAKAPKEEKDEADNRAEQDQAADEQK